MTHHVRDCFFFCINTSTPQHIRYDVIISCHCTQRMLSRRPSSTRLLFGMQPDSNEFTCFALILGGTVLAVGGATIMYWKPRLERHAALKKALSRYKHEGDVSELSRIYTRHHPPSSTSLSTEAVYHHDTHQWQTTLPFRYVDWYGVVRDITSTSNYDACYAMLSWHGTPQYVCPTAQNTFAVTDPATKTTREYAAVPYLNQTQRPSTWMRPPPSS